jgi:2-methylcitrate dehydratase PrpD
MARTSDEPVDDSAVTQQHASTIAETDFEDHPESVQALSRRAVRDGIANALLARETPLGTMYVNAGPSISSGPPLIGGSGRSPVDAAFANAGLWNALDWDDTVEGAGHPGSSIVSAALAVGLETDATIEEFLNGVILGYELAIRTANALRPSWDRYVLVHGSGTRHTLGAAAAAAAVAGYESNQVAELLGCAAQLAPVPHAAKFGWDEQRLTWLKDNNARAASAGVRAWQLVDGAFAGPRTVLDNEDGFWRMTGSDQCDWDTLATPLDEAYKLPKMAFKPYPCCRWLHSAVEATEAAVTDIEDVQSIEIETTRRVVESFVLEPSSQVNAEFSLPFVVGQAVADRDLIDWYGPEGPAPMPQFDLTVTESSTHTERFEGERVAGATVTVEGGNTTSTVTVERPRGGSNRPLDESIQDEKLKSGLSASECLDTTITDVKQTLKSDQDLATLANQLVVTADNEY